MIQSLAEFKIEFNDGPYLLLQKQTFSTIGSHGRSIYMYMSLSGISHSGTMAAFAAMHDQNSMFCERWSRGYDCALIYCDSRGFKQVDSLYCAYLSMFCKLCLCIRSDIS